MTTPVVSSTQNSVVTVTDSNKSTTTTPTTTQTELQLQAKRRVRFANISPESSVRVEEVSSLAGFSTPELAHDIEVSISRASSSAPHEEEEHDVFVHHETTQSSTQTVEERMRHVSFDTKPIASSTSPPTTTPPTTTTTLSTHLHEPTFAALPASAKPTKSVEYVDSESSSAADHSDDDLALHHTPTSTNLIPPNIQYLHPRTPSPSTSSIVAFSSRVKGSSVLFAPPKHLQALTPETHAVSPIDFSHHLIRNNAAYEQQASSSPFALPPSAFPALAQPSRLRSQSNSQSQIHHVAPSVSPLAPISSLPATLPSRDLSSLRHDGGVGHDTREHFAFEISSSSHSGDEESGLAARNGDGDAEDDEDLERDGGRDRHNPQHQDHRSSPRASPSPNSPASSDARLRQRMSLDFPSSTIPLASSHAHRPSVNQLPLYTRILRLFLIGVGVVRYISAEKAQKDAATLGSVGTPAAEVGGGGGSGSSLTPIGVTPLSSFPNRTGTNRSSGGAPCVLSFSKMVLATVKTWWKRFRSYVYPLIVFLFILTNIFFVSVSKNQALEDDPKNKSYNNWMQLVSDFCMNTAPLLSWLGAFYMVGWDDQRSFVTFFEQLSNLEAYNYRILRNYLVGSCVAGLFLMATTNLTSMNAYTDSDTEGNSSFFTLINVGLFVLLNYLITTFVICALASLICIFHYYSLKIFQEQLYSQGLSVQEAIKEHIVLMRLQHESAKYLQYIIFPPLILYTTGALLAAYNILSTQVYNNISGTAFQLILAFVTLMIPLVSGAQITSVCNDLARLATNLDLTNNLVERSSLIQQLVLLPGNAFQIFGVEINFGLLAKISYVVVAGTIVVARGASISTPSSKT